MHFNLRSRFQCFYWICICNMCINKISATQKKSYSVILWSTETYLTKKEKGDWGTFLKYKDRKF
jgi:hypothetical protein